MQKSEEIACEKRFLQMHLTVHIENLQAVGFYEGLGWHREEENGEWKGRMIKGIGF